MAYFPPEDCLEDVWKIALKYGASESQKKEFMDYFMNSAIFHEFRCLRSLGFGGKIYWTATSGFRAGIYPEDATDKLEALWAQAHADLEEVNEKIRSGFYSHEKDLKGTAGEI